MLEEEVISDLKPHMLSDNESKALGLSEIM